MTTPTPGALRAARRLANALPVKMTEARVEGMAAIIDDATGLPELVEALEGLFAHCAMIHNRWGEGSNQREADTVISQARAALAKARGEETT